MDNYKEKYNQALRKALDLYNQGLINPPLEHIFPELKVTEDERIRKAIKSGIKHLETQLGYDAVGGVDILDIYSWLEKQGEPNPYSGTSFKYNGHIWGMCARDNGVDILLDKQLFKHLEQQGEQSSDKIEPKFKVGDWISGYYTNYRVMAIHSKGYMVEDTDGTKMNILFENEKFHHLWTIQDAKDGDVLSGEIDDEVFVFLFNQIQDRWIVAHVYYSETEGEFIEKAYLHRDHLFSPAIKEQHDLLFAKMKEEGYKWDNEKRELKKV